MLNLKSILHPFFNRIFAFSFMGTLFFLVALYMVNINKDLLFIVLTLLFCLCLYLIRNGKSEKSVLGILAGLVTIVIAYYLYISWNLFFTIIEWDFLAFYVYGKAGADGLAFYDPASFTHMLADIHVPYTVGREFMESIIQVGVSYPPTSMLMIAPFGSLDLYTANVAWRIFLLSFLVIDMIMIYKMFLIHESKWFQVFIVIVLTLILRGTYTTVYVGQTVFFMLFFILLIYKDPDNWKSGVFLALAVMVKPIAVIWGLYYLIHLKWKPIISFSIAGSLLVLSSIMIFGFNNFLTFFTSNPTLRIPGFVYTDPINQSMNAVFSRTSMALGLESFARYKNWIVEAASLILVVLTCLASLRIAKTNSKMSFLIFLPLSLIIYLNTSLYYAPMLLPIFFSMLMIKDKISLLLLISFLLAMVFSCFAANLIILAVLIFYAHWGKPVFTSLVTRKIS